MSSQTLNIIYDTDYTKIINNGGFVDHSFTKKLWFWDLLFWDLSKKNNDSKKNTNAESWNQQSSNQNAAQPQNWQQPAQNEQTPQQTQTNNPNDKKDKAPWFFDLLFWDLSSWK